MCHYPFGMVMPGRRFGATGDYRFGFNGKEKDKDLSSLTAYDYGFRIYNPAIGKFLSVDPLTKSYPWYTPYQFAGNMPIWAIDIDGLEEYVITKELYSNGSIKKLSIQYTVKKEDPKSTLNMQFRQLLGKNEDGSDKLGDLLSDKEVVRIIKKPGEKEKVEFGNLTKVEEAIKNRKNRNDLSNPINDAWKLLVNGQVYTSEVFRDESTQQDKIAVQNYPLLKDKDLTFALKNSSLGVADNYGNFKLSTFDESKILRELYPDIQRFYDLPSMIKEDGGISSIKITLNKAILKSSNNKSNEKIVAQKMASQITEKYRNESRVKNASFQINYVEVATMDDMLEFHNSKPNLIIQLERKK